jgi:hypothetical protein
LTTWFKIEYPEEAFLICSSKALDSLKGREQSFELKKVIFKAEVRMMNG